MDLVNKSASSRLDEKLQLVSRDQTEVTHKAVVHSVKDLSFVPGALGEKVDAIHKTNKVGVLAGTTNKALSTVFFQTD